MSEPPEALSADEFLESIVQRLGQIAGVAAIVLGGSRVRGVRANVSDYDIGLYYVDADRFDVAALDQAAAELDDVHRTELLTPVGGWGPWRRRAQAR